MKTYKTAKEVKEALLSCETVTIKGWTANINSSNEVEITAPNGMKVANSLVHLERAIEDFMKEAGGMPDKTPKPVTYEKTPSGSGPLGDDTTSDSPWTDPKINKQPVQQGPTSEPGLGSDTTKDKPWTDPSVDKSPETEAIKDGLSDSDLGSDTTKNEVEWSDKLRGPGSQQAQYESGSNKAAQENEDSTNPSESDSEDSSFDPAINEDPHQILNQGEEVPSLGEFHANIVDTYADPIVGPSYQDLLNQSPSADLLRDIADPDKWAANQLYTTPYGNEEERMEPDKCSDCGGGDGGVGTGEGVSLPPGGSVTHPKKKKKEKTSAQQYVDNIKSAFHNTPVVEEFEAVSLITNETKKALNALVNKVAKSNGISKKKAQAGFAEYIMDIVASDDANAAIDAIESGVPMEAMYQVAYNADAENVLQALDHVMQHVATRIRENWGQDGTYSRDIDAETAEELYHITKSLGSDDDYDWARFKSVNDIPEPPINTPMTDSATGTAPGMVDAQIPEPMGISADKVKEALSGKKAVDDSAKSYWKDYFKDYGEQLVKDDSSKKKIDKKDPKTPEELKADRSVDDKYEPKVDETPKPEGQQKVKAQMAGGPEESAPIPTSPLGAGTPEGDGAAPPAGPETPPGPPAGPKPPQAAPGAGDEGLKSLGWTDQDIQAMSDEDKQKILQVKLKKPGSGVQETGQPKPAPVKPPIDPAGPGAGPEGGPAGPAPAPGPAPVPEKSPLAASVDKAFKMLTTAQAAPAPTAPEPAQPAAPAPAQPAAPAAPEFAGGDMAQDMSPESEALKIYNEIMEQEVKASTAEQVPAIKAQLLVQRLITEVGMPINEARNLFGLTKDKGFNTLFK